MIHSGQELAKFPSILFDFSHPCMSPDSSLSTSSTAQREERTDLTVQKQNDEGNEKKSKQKSKVGTELMEG